jgi:hypothetical protein
MCNETRGPRESDGKVEQIIPSCILKDGDPKDEIDLEKKSYGLHHWLKEVCNWAICYTPKCHT